MRHTGKFHPRTEDRGTGTGTGTGRVVAVVPKLGKIVKFFQRYVDEWRGGHRRV
jgi:hypothetical protein